MPATDCQHQDAAEIGRACSHLVDNEDPSRVDHYKRFTGRGREYDLLGIECRERPDEADVYLRVISMACFRHIEEEAMWDGTIGKAEVLMRPSDLVFEHEVVHLAGIEGSTLLDIQPVNGSSRSVWVALTASGELARLDLTERSATSLARLPESPVSLDRPVSLHVSGDGELAAIVNTKGEKGIVVDLRTGAVTMPLDRVVHPTAQSTFSLAFFERDGRPLLAHATAWKRLDISDPVTGRRLTDRTFEAPQPGETSRRHSFHYFHGSLAISPDQEWIVDDGWVWGSAGEITSWSLLQWLDENVWESEDGQSRREYVQRWWYWDGPMCWVGNRTLAFWGYGKDVDALLAAAWLFDAESGEEVGLIAGPVGTLVFDEYLFSFSDVDGTAVWDVATGERLLDPALCPTRYHRGARQFLTLLPEGAFRLSRLRG